MKVMMKYLFIIGLMLWVMAGATALAQPDKPADPKATKATKALYRQMKLLVPKGVMVGHQDALAYGKTWSDEPGRCDMKEASGSCPAVFGWDLAGIEHQSALNIDKVRFDKIHNWVLQVYKMGGINTFSWHLDNIVTGKNAWDVSSSDVVKSLLPGGAKNKEFSVWLDKVAAFLLSLKTDKGTLVPVIFRPYHEFSGSWFWWGQKYCSKNQYVEMWHYTIDYLRNTKGVHNLLTAYSSDNFATEAEFTDRYPGNNYVDIVGFDAYQFGLSADDKAKFIAGLDHKLKLLVKIAAQKGKIPALTETGLETLPDSTWFTTVLAPVLKESKVSYVLMWRNAHDKPNHFYLPYPGHSSVNDFKQFISLPYVLTLEKLNAK